MDKVFKALADPTRRAMLDRLNESGGQTLNELCGHFTMTRQGVMKHLAVLEAANVVVTVRRGREKLHYLNPVPINEIHERWIGKYERDRVEALSALKRNLEESGMDKPSFIYVTYIDTTPEKLWDALTNPEFTKQYWGGRRIESDWKVGSPVIMVDPAGGHDFLGEIMECEPRKILSYTWHTKPPSRVSFKLEPYGTVMRLTVTHDGLEPGSTEAQMTMQGWFAIMSSLKSLLETGKPLTYPWKG